MALKRLRERAGLSIRAVAEAIGRPHTTYARYEDRFKRRFLPLELAQALLPVLTSTGKIAPHEVMALAGMDIVRLAAPPAPPANLDPRDVSRATPPPPNATFAREVRLPLTMPQIPIRGSVSSGMPPSAPAAEDDIPIYSSAQGGETGMVVTFEEIERIRRPEPLLGVPRAFAMYVVGDSMSPAYEHGDTLLVHPSRAAGRGADVMLVKETDGQADAMVKRLVGWTKDKWKVQQFNPQRSFELPRKDWQRAYLVVGCYKARR